MMNNLIIFIFFSIFCRYLKTVSKTYSTCRSTATIQSASSGLEVSIFCLRCLPTASTATTTITTTVSRTRTMRLTVHLSSTNNCQAAKVGEAIFPDHNRRSWNRPLPISAQDRDSPPHPHR